MKHQSTNISFFLEDWLYVSKYDSTCAELFKVIGWFLKFEMAFRDKRLFNSHDLVMPRVICVHFSQLITHTPHTITKHTPTWILVSTLEHQVSWGHTNIEVVDY